MTKIEHLRHQADKADRLARDVADPLTAERLTSLSREYRQNAEALESSTCDEAIAHPSGETDHPNGQ